MSYRRQCLRSGRARDNPANSSIARVSRDRPANGIRRLAFVPCPCLRYCWRRAPRPCSKSKLDRRVMAAALPRGIVPCLISALPKVRIQDRSYRRRPNSQLSRTAPLHDLVQGLCQRLVFLRQSAIFQEVKARGGADGFIGTHTGCFRSRFAPILARAQDAAGTTRARQFHFIVGVGVGGAFDAYARMIAPYLSKETGARRYRGKPARGGRARCTQSSLCHPA